MVRKLLLPALLLIQFTFPNLSYSQIKTTPIMPDSKPATRPATNKNPNLLFEGYSKILMGGVHVGYTVLRYEFDPKKKQFQATYLVKTEELGGNILEGLKAVADQDLKPISYEYTSLVDKKSKVIDAKFTPVKTAAPAKKKPGKPAPLEIVARMNATVKDGKDSKKVVADIPQGAFLGIFLYYVILRSPKGLQTETRYDYKAIAEEDAKLFDGFATIGKEEKFNGLRAFKAANTFKDSSYSFYLTDTGEAIMTDTPSANVKTILVAKPQEAIANFKIPTAVMNSLFGEMPLGITNAVSKNLAGEAAAANAPPGNKREGIPPDPKIMIKGNPDE